MATSTPKPIGVQQAKRLMQKLEDTPIQTPAGMSTYLEAYIVALNAWGQASSDLGAAPLRRHITLLEESFDGFRNNVQAWYRKRGAEEYQQKLFSRLDVTAMVLADLMAVGGVSIDSPPVQSLQHAVIFLSRHLEKTTFELASGTLRPHFETVSDGGYCDPVFKRKEDGVPTWPMCPFSVWSRDNKYDNHIYGRWDVDPRPRYAPSRQNVATFRRWNRDFNPWGPRWRDWEAILIQHCGLKVSQCEELEIPQIIGQLDHTPIENEMQVATEFLEQLATRSQLLETIHMDESKKIRYRKLMAAEVSALLLKVHHFERREIYVIAQIYPGIIGFDKFCSEMICRLGSEHEGPYREGVLRLLAAVATVLIPWCGDSAIEAKRSLEQRIRDSNPKISNDPTGDYLTENVAKLFDKRDVTVRLWCREKTKPCHNAYKTGATWRVPRTDIEDALSSR